MDKARSITARLDDLCHDWDGSEMPDEAETRVSVSCGLVREAVDKIEGLEADLENAVETAFKRGAIEWTRLNYPTLFARFANRPPEATK